MFLLKNLYGKLKFHYDHTKMDNTDRKKQRGKVLAPHIFHAKEEDLMKILCYASSVQRKKGKLHPFSPFHPFLSVALNNYTFVPFL